MTIAALSLFLLLLQPQNPTKPGRLILPKPSTPAPAQQAAAQKDAVSEAEQFHKEALSLRRSLARGPGEVEVILSRIGEKFDEPEVKALALARQADADLLHGLMLILQRFGRDRAGEDLHFLLLTRPFGDAAAPAVVTMTQLLSRERAKDALFALLSGRHANVRGAAVDLLLTRVTAEDLPRLLTLSRERNEDVQRRALSLLGAVPGVEARARLLEALRDRSGLLATAAMRALLAHGDAAIPELVHIAEAAPMDRSFGYAILGLVTLEDQIGRELLTEAMLPHLKREVVGLDSFLRVASAIALANMSFRSGDRGGQVYSDAAVVEALLLVAAPRDFVDNLSLLQGPATQKLMQLTGQDFRGRSRGWLTWWEANSKSFVGARLQIALDETSAAEAMLTWRDRDQVIRIRGEEAQDPGPADAQTQDILLSGSEMLALVERLKGHGFMGQGSIAAMATGALLTATRELELRVGAGRARVAGPATTARWIDGLESEIRAVAVAEQWQLYRDPVQEADFKEFWRAERAWHAAHPDPDQRQLRLKDRIVAALPGLPQASRVLALRTLHGTPDLKNKLTPADGLALVSAAAASKQLDETTKDILEIALQVEGDAVWPQALSVYVQLFESGGRRALSPAMALLGPARLHLAVEHPDKKVRVAAMHEVANLGDLDAVPVLQKALSDPDSEVAETAVFALGELRDPSTRELLMEVATKAGTPPGVRRTAWVALGRIGGNGVFEILRAALAEPSMADRMKAMQGLGELKTREAAEVLAQVFAAHGLDPLGTQALLSLRSMGAILARSALARFAEIRDPRLRREIVLALAEFQDPSVVPDLIMMLDAPADSAHVAVLLSCITGMDVAGLNDRAPAMREWWRLHREVSQGDWFLMALRREGVETTLDQNQLMPMSGADAVPELARLLVRLQKAHLRVLCAALLREVTGRDFGLVNVRTVGTELQAVADRYLFAVEAERAGRGR